MGANPDHIASDDRTGKVYRQEEEQGGEAEPEDLCGLSAYNPNLAGFLNPKPM